MNIGTSASRKLETGYADRQDLQPGTATGVSDRFCRQVLLVKEQILQPGKGSANRFLKRLNPVDKDGLLVYRIQSCKWAQVFQTVRDRLCKERPHPQRVIGSVDRKRLYI